MALTLHELVAYNFPDVDQRMTCRHVVQQVASGEQLKVEGAHMAHVVFRNRDMSSVDGPVIQRLLGHTRSGSGLWSGQNSGPFLRNGLVCPWPKSSVCYFVLESSSVSSLSECFGRHRKHFKIEASSDESAKG